MSKSRAPYPVEFRKEAIQLARTSGRRNAEIARDLGMTAGTLRIWLTQAAVDEGRAEGLTTDERDELRHLRHDNRILREEREILKKAAAFFAKESDTIR